MDFRRLLWSGLAFLTMAFVHLSAQPPARPDIDIFADGARPLSKAVEELEKRFGWIITYEDAPYLHASDVRDATRDGLPFSFMFTGVPDEEFDVVEQLHLGRGLSVAALS